MYIVLNSLARTGILASLVQFGIARGAGYRPSGRAALPRSRSQCFALIAERRLRERSW